MVLIRDPLQLYRRILRIHRLLPTNIRYVGDKYVAQEFRQHKYVKEAKYLNQFFQQWNSYLGQLEGQITMSQITTEKKFGTKLSESIIRKLDDDKATQLLDLYNATRLSNKK